MGIHLQSIDTPAEADVPVWVTDHWEYQPAAVTTANGLGGDGTVADPIVALTSGVFGAAPWLDQFLNLTADEGKPVYIDTAGMLRSAPDRIVGPKAVADLPSTYPPGLSMLWQDSATASASGWGAQAQAVLTMREGDQGTQLRFVQHTTGTPPYTDNIVFRRGDATGWLAWVVVVGADSLWQNCTNIAAGWTVPVNGGTPQARKVGNRVQMRGNLKHDTYAGSSGGAFIHLCTLPAGITSPLTSSTWPQGANTTAVGAFNILTDEKIMFWRSAASTTAVDFGSITYIVN